VKEEDGGDGVDVEKRRRGIGLLELQPPAWASWRKASK